MKNGEFQNAFVWKDVTNKAETALKAGLHSKNNDLYNGFVESKTRLMVSYCWVLQCVVFYMFSALLNDVIQSTALTKILPFFFTFKIWLFKT